ncbi:DedA family protein [Thermobifida halotolerans]|uniref:DedA family protein n=1 Tax=Thermobifida halotolerans TaxID=483545 RepID=A0AA97LVM2_9ACTN|nr:DedA family protein [Thermobifida halotolerans]UOE18919.1 DedA family protein [Thermobifida halotolerans]
MSWVVGLMGTLGGPGAGLIIALENVFPPIPSEAVLPLAGFAASRGELGLVEAVAWTTAGSVVGALVLYWLGALLGRDRVRRIAARMPLAKVSDIERTEAWFLRHGTKAVFFGRMVPLFRSFVSIPAGIERMPVPLFVALTATGSLIWNTVFVLSGYLLGENRILVERYAGLVSKGVVVAVGVAVLYFAVVRVRELRRAKNGDDRLPEATG